MMLKKFLSFMAIAAIAIASVMTPAAAANRSGDASWSSNGRTLTIRPDDDRAYTFGASTIYGAENACSPSQVERIVNDYPGSDTRRIPYIGTISSIIGELNAREHRDGIYWEFTDCGADLGGLLSGVLCIDFESGWQDRARVFEACANVAEIRRGGGYAPQARRQIRSIEAVDY